MPSELHIKLQNIAELYLRNKNYWVVGQEVRMPVGICDVWGMNSFKEAMAIEVKVSRSDFRSGSQKYKENSNYNLGDYQYILCPSEMITPEECHNKWGLLWWSGKIIVNKKKAPKLNITADEKLAAIMSFLDNGVNIKRPLLN
jgi:hypothetical protein